MSARRPCPSCPWRVDQDATAIPNFNLHLAEDLWRTCRRNGYGQEFGDPQFACHQSREGDEIVCAGWLAMQGSSHPAVRIAAMTGALDPDALSPGPDWPELHEEFDDVIEKLRLTA
jgi:hypothetical protein